MTADERAVRSVEEREVTAILEEDLGTLERLWSERFIVNNPQHGITATRAEVLALVKQGQIRYSAFDRRIEAIRFDGDIAIVMGSETVVRKSEAASAGAAPQPIRRRYTNIWKRTPSGWKEIARHANVIPPS